MTRKTDDEMAREIELRATALYLKHPTWSTNKLAAEIKNKDSIGDIPVLESRIRQLISERCPQIPKRAGGRPPKTKKNNL